MSQVTNHGQDQRSGSHADERDHPTTTHDPAHDGSPRLAVEREYVLEGSGSEEQVVHYLDLAESTIGSAASADIVLPGLAPRHAVVRHGEDDEFRILTDGPEVRVHGRPVTEQLLRSGARIELGAHVLAYYRDEHADHGRPFGGRVGGEAGRQRPQPSRTQLDRTEPDDRS